MKYSEDYWIFSQTNILKRLKNKAALRLDYILADNITRAKYADFLNPEESIEFKNHFMFHTTKEFNGFSDGEKYDSRHSILNSHCCWCSGDSQCAEARLKVAVRVATPL